MRSRISSAVLVALTTPGTGGSGVAAPGPPPLDGAAEPLQCGLQAQPARGVVEPAALSRGVRQGQEQPAGRGRRLLPPRPAGVEGVTDGVVEAQPPEQPGE